MLGSISNPDTEEWLKHEEKVKKKNISELRNSIGQNTYIRRQRVCTENGE